MNKVKQVPKKGLKAIFGDNLKRALNDIEKYKTSQTILRKVLINKIKQNPYQPRKIFDKNQLQELANSIKTQGLISPISIIRSGKEYILVAGERRFRAHKILKLKEIDAIEIRLDLQKSAEIALIENLQREDLNSIEEAEAFNTLVKNYNLTQEQLAKKISKSRTYVANSLRLLKLPLEVKQMVFNKKLSSSHAKVILGLKSIDDIIELAKKSIKNKWNVRQIEDFIKKFQMSKTKKNVKLKSKNILYAEQLIREKLDAQIDIRRNKIIIKYNSVSDLNRILEKMDVLEK